MQFPSRQPELCNYNIQKHIKRPGTLEGWAKHSLKKKMSVLWNSQFSAGCMLWESLCWLFPVLCCGKRVFIIFFVFIRHVLSVCAICLKNIGRSDIHAAGKIRKESNNIGIISFSCSFYKSRTLCHKANQKQRDQALALRLTHRAAGGERMIFMSRDLMRPCWLESHWVELLHVADTSGFKSWMHFHVQ